jgi:hypothetical protein
VDESIKNLDGVLGCFCLLSGRINGVTETVAHGAAIALVGGAGNDPLQAEGTKPAEVGLGL